MDKGNKFLLTPVSLACSWYLAAVLTLTFSLLLLVYLSFPQTVPTPKGTHYQARLNRAQAYKALPLNTPTGNALEIEIGMGDGRALIVDDFLESRRSPLNGLGDEFVKAADRYGLDFRLLPAIAIQESGGGKVMPNNSYNPFGYGIYGGKVMRFVSFEEAIGKVAQGLKRDYIDQGLKTPDEIMPKYAPPSLQKGGAWAIGVSALMEQLI